MHLPASISSISISTAFVHQHELFFIDHPLIRKDGLLYNLCLTSGITFLDNPLYRRFIGRAKIDVHNSPRMLIRCTFKHIKY